MSYQAIGLALIFLIGSLASCLQIMQEQKQAIEPEAQGRIAPAITRSQSEAEAASAALDNGLADKACKLYQAILQDDLSGPDSRRARAAVDLNNEAVALYLSARQQTDRKRAEELLQLSRNCLATAQSLAQKSDLSQVQMAVSYNQYMLIDLLGEQSRASRILQIASRRRRDLKPDLPDGLLP